MLRAESAILRKMHDTLYILYVHLLFLKAYNLHMINQVQTPQYNGKCILL